MAKPEALYPPLGDNSHSKHNIPSLPEPKLTFCFYFSLLILSPFPPKIERGVASVPWRIGAQ